VNQLPLLQSLLLPAAIVVCVAQPAQAQVTPVTAVQLTPTEGGIELTLETSTGQPLQSTTTREGNTFIVDILDAQLRLSEEPTFRQENPTEEIALITVAPLTENSVRVTIVGVNEIPAAVVTQSDRGLVLSVTPSATTAETPESTELPPSSPSSPTDSATPPMDSEFAEDEEEEIVVTATRTEEQPENLDRSVTVIRREQIQEQSALTRNLGDILGKLVPGFGPPNQLRTTRAQTLRGREPLILVDGVPLNTNFRVNRQELRSIDPAAIERVEVVRGPSAIYGGQATGGIINIITRAPVRDGVEFQTEVGVNGSIGDFEDDGFGNTFSASMAAKVDNFDFRVSASREKTGAFFDADGDRIVSEGILSDTEAFNLLGKFGVNLDANQRIQFSANYFDSQKESDFIADPITTRIPGRQKARALEIEGLRYEKEPQDRNVVLDLTYTHRNLLGSRVLGQLYFQDVTARGEFADGRRGGEFFPALFQSRLEGERWGGRLQIETPLTRSGNLNLLWGADYESQENSQLTDIFNSRLFDQQQRLDKINEIVFTPPYELDSLGLFGQLEWNANDRLTLRGGIRHESIDLKVDDYTSIRGQAIQGGERDFSDTVFNLGTVFRASENISFFANLSQGFSVPEFSRILRLPPRGFISVADDIDVTEPIQVTEYELGVRGQWRNIQMSLSGFFNESDLGASLVANNLGELSIARAPQRVYGIEASVDWQISNKWSIGGILGWSEGENDINEDGDYLALTSGEIQPLKLVAYVQNETLPGWNNRLQALYVGNRDRAVDDGVDPTPIDSYVVLDFISSIKLGSGTLSIGIENLLDTEYYPVVAQFLSGFDDRNYVAGRGRTLRVLYSITW
jgi:iron complex outermembrane recepter protein